MLDKKVADLINTQVNKEFYSAYLYLDFANFYVEQGLNGFANWYQVQAQEERDHAMLFVKYLQNNDAKVTYEAIDKPNIELKNNMDPLHTLEVDEAKTSLCGTKAGADMKDGLRINYIHHNKQVVEKPALFGEGVAFFSGEEKPAGDYEQELFYHIVADGAEQVVKPAQAAVVTRVLEAIYESAKSGKTIYFD